MIKIYTCGACRKPCDNTCRCRAITIDGQEVIVRYCKPCIDNIQKMFQDRIDAKTPKQDNEGDAWSTATWDSD